MVATRVPESVPRATPWPRPLGGLAGAHPNFAAAALRTPRIFSSRRCLSRNSTGSIPAAAAMMSICDSRANVLVLLAGARQAPVAKGWDRGVPPQPDPWATVAWSAML